MDVRMSVQGARSRGAWPAGAGQSKTVHPLIDPSPPAVRPNVSPWRQLADRWALCGHQQGLLLSGEALYRAEAWAAEHAEDLTDIEHDYLLESREALGRVRRDRRRQWSISFLASASLLVALLAIRTSGRAIEERHRERMAKESAQVRVAELGAARLAEIDRALAEARARSQAEAKRREAQRGERQANARALAAMAQVVGEEDVQLGILLAAQAMRLARAGAFPDAAAIEAATTALYRALGHEGWERPPSAMDLPDDAGVLMAWPSGDGRFLCTQGKVWDAAAGRCLVSLAGLTGAIRDAAWAPGGDRVVAVGDDGIAAISDSATGVRLAALRGASQPITRVSWSPDGSWIATMGEGSEAVIWDAAAGDAVRRLPGCIGAAGPPSWDERSQSLAAICGGTAMSWDADSGERLYAFRPDVEAAQEARCVGDDAVGIWSAGAGGEIVYSLWDGSTGERLSQDIKAETRFQRVAMLAKDDGPIYFAGAEDLLDLACSRVARNLTRAEWQRYAGRAAPYQCTCPGLPPEE